MQSGAGEERDGGGAGDAAGRAAGSPVHEERLRDSARLLARAEAIARLGSWTVELATGETVWSDELYRLYGYEPGEVQASEALWHHHLHPPHRQPLAAALRRLVETGEPYRLDIQIVRRDGAVRVLDSRGHAVRDAEGRVVRIEGSAQDVTERVQAERMLHAVVEQSLAGIYVIQDGRFRYVNPTVADVFGYTVDEVLALPSVEALVAPRDRERVVTNVLRRLAGERAELRYGFRGLCRDGREVEVEVHGRTAEVDGRPAVVGVLIDVTERRRAEAALVESEARFRTVARVTSDVVWDWDLRTDRIWWGETLHELFRIAADEVEDTSDWWADRIHPEDAPRVTEGLQAVLDAGGTHWSDEYRFRRGDGTYAVVQDRCVVLRAAEGRAVRVVGAMLDVTERRQLEEQVRQAQKMEAIGRLAGGVAHDFNNLLTAILSTAQLALIELEPGHPARTDIEEIRHAGERAAGLTRQLLAFSRRQVLQPQLLDVCAVVRDTERLLQRLLGAAVRLELRLDPRAGLVRADRGQLEQVLVNLVVNARDAMPAGGTLTITVQPGERPAGTPAGPAEGAGRWVTLQVRDTGIGMDAETRARVFEPFFTTKPVGQGTGLGLATVYGIVQQSGGVVRVESAPAAGTTFTIDLPAAAPPPAAAAATAAVAAAAPATVLLVEDEPAVRQVARRLLERAGYHVLEARDGVEALELHERAGGRVDLVLSDVVMPRLGGLALVARLRARDPRCRVLLMSGNAAAVAGLDHPIVGKPFETEALLRSVRAALDAEPPAG